MAAIEDNKRFLKQYHFITSRKNKVNSVSDPDPVIELQRAPVAINVIHQHSDKSSLLSSEEYETFLVCFFKISYYLGITPHYWKIVESGKGPKKVESSSSKLHTVAVASVHSCAILRFLMRFCLLSYDLNNPINYFKIARTVLSTSLCSFFVWSLWRRYYICQQILCRIANLSYFPNVTSLRRKAVQYSIFFVSIGALCLTSVHRAIEECSQRWKETVCKDDNVMWETLCNDNYTAWFVKGLFCIFNYFGRTTRRLPRMELLTIALTIWQFCKSFGRFLRQRNEQLSPYQNHEIMSVLLAYEELKSISNLIRDFVGEMLVSEIVEDIVYFSLEVQQRLRQTDWFSIFVVFETWLMAFLAYFIAACAAEHIQEVSVWIARDDVLSKLSPGKVTTLHMQLSSHPIGMKGGSLFTLTKSFLANVSTVWVTYFIILLQFRVGTGKDEL